MKVAIIPAKGNSQRIKYKNRKIFHGRPIITYSIDVAKAAKIFDHVFVSTENQAIKSIALTNGAEVIDRPKELTEDSIGTQAVTKHAISELKLEGHDVVCCLYPTAPLRQVSSKI